jgi:hypothetical protein
MAVDRAFPGCRISDLQQFHPDKTPNQIADLLKADGWYQKRIKEKGVQGPRRWYPSSVPKDHRLSGNSTLYGVGGAAVGAIDQQWLKTKQDGAEPKFEPQPEGFAITRISTFTTAAGVTGQWSSADRKKSDQFKALEEAIGRVSERFRGDYKPIIFRPESVLGVDWRTWIPIGDAHLGMLAWGREVGEDFDLRIAEQDLFETVQMLIQQAPATENCIIADVGDFFHADNKRQETEASGHRLDCDSRQDKITDVGFAVSRRLIETALLKFPTVDWYSAGGNHDEMTSKMMIRWLRAVFENEPRVKIHSNVAPRQYIEWGNNFWGITHGHEIKPAELMSVMSEYDHGRPWGRCPHREWHTGHVHHESVKEYRGGTVYTYNTLAGKDAWHNAKGYVAKRFLTSRLYHEKWGFRGSNVMPLNMVRWLRSAAQGEYGTL